MPLHRPPPIRKTTAASRRRRLSVPPWLIGRNARCHRPGVGAFTRLSPRSSLRFALAQSGIYLGLLPADHLQPPCQGAAHPDGAALHHQPADAAAARGRRQPVRAGDLGNPGAISPGRPAASQSATAARAIRSGSSPNTAPVPATCATSSTTPMSGVRLRVALCYRWVRGIATVCPHDDPLARQRRIIAWHPLRGLNAINVRVGGADLLSVHVQLNTTPEGGRRLVRPDRGRPAQDTGPEICTEDGDRDCRHRGALRPRSCRHPWPPLPDRRVPVRSSQPNQAPTARRSRRDRGEFADYSVISSTETRSALATPPRS